MTEIVESFIEGSKEGVKNYSAQIVSSVLLLITMWLFPSLRNFVGKSLLEIINKIFRKSQTTQNNEAEPEAEPWDEIPEESYLTEIEDQKNTIEIPKWFKKRRRKEKHVNITKDGVTAFFLVCLGLLILIFSLWRINFTNLIEFLGIAFIILAGCFAAIVVVLFVGGVIWAALTDEYHQPDGCFLIILFIVSLLILGSFFSEFREGLSEPLGKLSSINLLNLLWIFGVLAGCAFGFLAFRIRARNVNAHMNAAERGNGEAQYKLGVAYYNKGNYRLSYMWYQLAYLCGYEKAKTTMVEMEKIISPSEVAEATNEAQRKFDRIMQTKSDVIQYYRTKAWKGDRIAQYNLGYVYQHGEDVEQNNYSAYVWYSVAMLSGDRQAKSQLSQLRDKFLPSQLEQAEAEAKRNFNIIQQRKRQK